MCLRICITPISQQRYIYGVWNLTRIRLGVQQAKFFFFKSFTISFTLFFTFIIWKLKKREVVNESRVLRPQCIFRLMSSKILDFLQMKGVIKSISLRVFNISFFIPNKISLFNERKKDINISKSLREFDLYSGYI